MGDPVYIPMFHSDCINLYGSSANAVERNLLKLNPNIDVAMKSFWSGKRVHITVNQYGSSLPNLNVRKIEISPASLPIGFCYEPRDSFVNRYVKHSLADLKKPRAADKPEVPDRTYTYYYITDWRSGRESDIDVCSSQNVVATPEEKECRDSDSDDSIEDFEIEQIYIDLA